MYVFSEETPNPAVLKFLPGMPVAAVGLRAVRGGSGLPPLAIRLFAELEQVSELYFGADFIAVTKNDGNWSDLRPSILEAIADIAAAFVPTAAPVTPPRAGVSGADADTLARIEAVLESHIRPAVASDGGNIMLEDFADGVVYVRMQGACSGCPSASLTLRNGVENTLRHFIPEVREVRAL